MVRITINGVQSQFSIKLLVLPDQWDSKKEQAKGQLAEARNLSPLVILITITVRWKGNGRRRGGMGGIMFTRPKVWQVLMEDELRLLFRNMKLKLNGIWRKENPLYGWCLNRLKTFRPCFHTKTGPNYSTLQI